MNTFEQSSANVSKVNPMVIASFWIAISALLAYTFRVGLNEMIKTWVNVEEYGHGFFLPLISAYFIWLRRNELRFVQTFSSALPGLILVILGVSFGLLGGLATVKTLEQYAFIVTVTGIFGATFGMRGLKIAAIPLLFLIFMVPFPNFILNNLSSKLQLISSWIGVEFIRACNIMVYLEGNVIDLGGYKLQVVDACSGLRYLFPLASLSFLCAYLFRGAFWQKALVFLSSIPLTIFMNSFRIGVIGIMVQYWGTEMAEGFLHDFEGWIIFMACLALLLAEMWLFARLNGQKLALNDLVRIPEEWGSQPKIADNNLRFTMGLWAVLGVLVISALLSQHYAARVELIPDRKVFLNFPLKIGAWQGRNDYIGQKYLDELKLTDYVIVNYVNDQQRSGVNFYVAYFQSQRTGATIHSPKSCIPGDGWQISDFSQRAIANVELAGKAIAVNRAVIEKANSRQLVYYWFQQRGRSITNEFMAKWYLFYDALTMNRTDGSLIRIITTVLPAEDINQADQRLVDFMRDSMKELPPYLPGAEVATIK